MDRPWNTVEILIGLVRRPNFESYTTTRVHGSMGRKQHYVASWFDGDMSLCASEFYGSHNVFAISDT